MKRILNVVRTFHMSYSVFRILKGLKFTMPPKISNYYLQKQDFLPASSPRRGSRYLNFLSLGTKSQFTRNFFPKGNFLCNIDWKLLSHNKTNQKFSCQCTLTNYAWLNLTIYLIFPWLCKDLVNLINFPLLCKYFLNCQLILSIVIMHWWKTHTPHHSFITPFCSRVNGKTLVLGFFF